MKKALIVLLLLSMAIPVFAVSIEEKQNLDTIEFTITFTKEEFDIFMLDKADPKEWIRNACQANTNRQKEFIQRDLVNQLIVPTEDKVKEKIKEEKIKRNQKIQEQLDKGGPGVIYE